MPQLLSLVEAAAELGVSRKTLEREIARKRFPKPLKIGKASRVKPSDLTDYIGMLEKERSAKGGLPAWKIADDEAQRQREKQEREESEGSRPRQLGRFPFKPGR
jgi:predicted DNA-binding transcriptional regulator AlpA